MHWMLLPLKRYADFSGRSRRMEYWMFTLLNVIVTAVLLGPAILLGDTATSSQDFSESGGFGGAAAFNSDFGDSPVAMLLAGLWLLYILAVFIPSIAVTVRRFHDRNMSGWWYLGFIVAGLIPLIGFLTGIAFLVLMFLPGTPGPNRFGEDPKDPTQASVFE